MEVTDVATLLDITIDPAKTAIYQARLDAAKDQAKEYCKNDFLVVNEDLTTSEVIPLGAQMGIALIVQAMGEKQSVASQTLGDMSKTFYQNGTYLAALKYLKPYRKVKMV